MKQFLSLVIKETRHILRDPRTMLILFGMPVVLMLLFGFAITNDVRNVRTVVVATNTDGPTRQLVDRLAASDYFRLTCSAGTPQEAERLIRGQQADMAVVFGGRQASGVRDIQLVVDGSDPNMAQQWVAYARGVLLQPSASSCRPISGGTATGTASGIQTKLLYNPQMRSAYNFVPAIMGMLLLLVCAMMTSVSIVREKERGTMELLLVSPVRPFTVIVAKAVPYFLQALLILAVVLTVSFFVLRVPLAGSLVWIVVVSLIYILLALSLGLLISSIAETQFVALLASAMMLLLPTVMLSGMLFPVESMPRVLQYVSAIVPPRYYISAMRKLMIMGASIGDVTQEVAVLSGMTAVLLTVALKKFRVRSS